MYLDCTIDINSPGAAEAGVPGVPRNTQYLAIDKVVRSIFHIFAPSSPILINFTVLKMALKFISTSSLLQECGSQNKGATRGGGLRLGTPKF